MLLFQDMAPLLIRKHEIMYRKDTFICFLVIRLREVEMVLEPVIKNFKKLSRNLKKTLGITLRVVIN